MLHWLGTRRQAARAGGTVRRFFGAPPRRHTRVIPHSVGKVFGVILTHMKIIPKKELTSGDLIFDFSREGKIRMNQTNGPVNRIKAGLVTGLGITLIVIAELQVVRQRIPAPADICGWRRWRRWAWRRRQAVKRTTDCIKTNMTNL
jgi:hypothetical protein